MINGMETKVNINSGGISSKIHCSQNIIEDNIRTLIVHYFPCFSISHDYPTHGMVYHVGMLINEYLTR
jgi:hypothetical protein